MASEGEKTTGDFQGGQGGVDWDEKEKETCDSNIGWVPLGLKFCEQNCGGFVESQICMKGWMREGFFACWSHCGRQLKHQSWYTEGKEITFKNWDKPYLCVVVIRRIKMLSEFSKLFYSHETWKKIGNS